MLIAAIDRGNTRCKVGIFSPNGLLENVEIVENYDNAIAFLNAQNIDKAISNSFDETEIIPSFNLIKFDYDFKLPFINKYQTPNTLGIDRIAAVTAVSLSFKNQNTLVFNAGTCLTIEFLNENNEYLGGNISPGLHMRLKAMNTFTQKLPLSTIENIITNMGNSTLSALANGAYYGMLNEIEGYINYYNSQYNQLNVVLCGGDTIHFDKQLKTKIFAQPNLVLEGLYQILRLNENK